jgi:hypothetical protein
VYISYVVSILESPFCVGHETQKEGKMQRKKKEKKYTKKEQNKNEENKK